MSEENKPESNVPTLDDVFAERFEEEKLSIGLTHHNRLGGFFVYKVKDDYNGVWKYVRARALGYPGNLGHKDLRTGLVRLYLYTICVRNKTLDIIKSMLAGYMWPVGQAELTPHAVFTIASNLASTPCTQASLYNGDNKPQLTVERIRIDAENENVKLVARQYDNIATFEVETRAIPSVINGKPVYYRFSGGVNSWTG